MLRQLLPEGAEVQTSFESVGHIAHLNLKEELLPYRQLVGQVGATLDGGCRELPGVP